MATSPFNSGGGKSSGIWSVIIIVTYIHGELSWTAFLLGDRKKEMGGDQTVKECCKIMSYDRANATSLDVLVLFS